MTHARIPSTWDVEADLCVSGTLRLLGSVPALCLLGTWKNFSCFNYASPNRSHLNLQGQDPQGRASETC